jgi:serine/threonine-protein kinase
MLQMIQGRVGEIAEIGNKALYQHGTLADVLARAREGRESIARQMDGLNASAHGVRKQLQPLRTTAEQHGDKAAPYPAEMRHLHRELMRWEGRSAFSEPYRELAAAHRELADVIDRWWEVRSAQLACERQAEEQEEGLRELESQHDELREGLRIHESNLAAEVEACESALRSLGQEADKLELELLDLASRFSAPLRSKPELGACFRELTQVS